MHVLTRYSCILFVFSSSLFVGCGTNTGPFTVTPSNLTFEAAIDDPAPVSQAISIEANSAETIPPDVTASGEAITTISTTCSNYDNCFNLDYTLEDNKFIVTVPVVKPSSLGIGTHTGSILIKSVDHSVTVNVVYEISSGTPEITQVAPYIATEGAVNEVIIRGSGFTRLEAASTTISFGDTNATTLTLINDTTIKATHPALDAGDYAISIGGSDVNFPSTASLKVISSITFSAASIAHADMKGSPVYDAERQALYIVNTNTDEIEKYVYSAGSWDSTPAATLLIENLGAVDLSMDGTVLVAVANSNFYEVDPDSLELISSKEAVGPVWDELSCTYDPCFDSVAFSNNGKAIAIDNNQWNYFYIYDPSDNSVKSSAQYFGYSEGNLWGADIHGSRDGGRILLTDAYHPVVYDTASLQLLSIELSGLHNAISGNGSIVISGSSVLQETTEEYASHGTLPVVPDSVAISYDGKTAYVYLSDNNVVQAYDISTAQNFTQINSDYNLSTIPGNDIKMILSPDGNTLFVQGNSNIVILPL